MRQKYKRDNLQPHLNDKNTALLLRAISTKTYKQRLYETICKSLCELPLKEAFTPHIWRLLTQILCYLNFFPPESIYFFRSRSRTQIYKASCRLDWLLSRTCTFTECTNKRCLNRVIYIQYLCVVL